MTHVRLLFLSSMCSEFILFPVHYQIRLSKEVWVILALELNAWQPFPRAMQELPKCQLKMHSIFFFLDYFDMGALLERIQQLAYLGFLGCALTACFCNQSLLPPHCFLAKV